jgi:hypothetical protein
MRLDEITWGLYFDAHNTCSERLVFLVFNEGLAGPTCEASEGLCPFSALLHDVSHLSFSNTACVGISVELMRTIVTRANSGCLPSRELATRNLQAQNGIITSGECHLS